MKKYIAIVMIAILIFSFQPVFAVGETISAKAAVVVETQTGAVLYENNADEQVFPAGLAKLMTFLLAYEALESGSVKAEDMVSVSPNAASKGGTSVFLDAGSSYALQDLLNAAIVSSGNDAATAIAEHVCGTEQAFVDKMNARATELGLTCHFADACGLNKETRASAREFGVIAAALANHPQFFSFSSIWTYTFTHNSGRETELTNANRLVKSENYDGMLTGSSAEAGYCAAVSAKSGKARYVCIILGADNSDARFSAAEELLSYSASQYSVYEGAKAGAKIKTAEVKGTAQLVDLYAKEDLVLLVPKDQEQGIAKSLEIAELTAPLSAGQTVGSLIVTLADGTKYCVDLVVKEEVAAQNIGASLSKILYLWLYRE